MAAKKAPAKKMAAPKPATKKSGTADSSKLTAAQKKALTASAKNRTDAKGNSGMGADSSTKYKTPSSLNRVTSNIPSFPSSYYGGSGFGEPRRSARGYMTGAYRTWGDPGVGQSGFTMTGPNRQPPGKSTKKSPSPADFRMKEEADKAKAYNNPSNKDAKDARGRSTKYGTPVGETKIASSGKPFKSRPNTELVRYTTTVVKNGVRYAVVETKEKTKGGPDKRSTRVTKNTKK